MVEAYEKNQDQDFLVKELIEEFAVDRHGQKLPYTSCARMRSRRASVLTALCP
ncbi:MAG: hypothetical protein ACJATK_000948 [Paracoccaceae bacterium]|jgi:hypothetical protein